MFNFKERGLFGLKSVKTKLDEEITVDIAEFKQWRMFEG
jgi:hypothetical protein